MQLLELTLPTLEENLALDEALLLDAERGGPSVLRFWEWSRPAVIVGAGGKVAEEAVLQRCTDDGVPILRRSSGGGTVLLGPGCLLYSLILAFDDHAGLADLHASYCFILGRMVAALGVPDVHCAGISDLVLAAKKFSGNSQQRKRAHVLHHGTLLYAFDLSRIPYYVQHPPRMPAYRCDRSHEEFVCNLPLSADQLRTRIADAWSAMDGVAAWPEPDVARLVAEKYAQSSWHHRR
jgi:lipoate-protein ligase A